MSRYPEILKRTSPDGFRKIWTGNDAASCSNPLKRHREESKPVKKAHPFRTVWAFRMSRCLSDAYGFEKIGSKPYESTRIVCQSSQLWNPVPSMRQPVSILECSFQISDKLTGFRFQLSPWIQNIFLKPHFRFIVSTGCVFIRLTKTTTYGVFTPFVNPAQKIRADLRFYGGKQKKRSLDVQFVEDFIKILLYFYLCLAKKTFCRNLPEFGHPPTDGIPYRLVLLPDIIERQSVFIHRNSRDHSMMSRNTS
jgi:hypothetical protein